MAQPRSFVALAFIWCVISAAASLCLLSVYGDGTLTRAFVVVQCSLSALLIYLSAVLPGSRRKRIVTQLLQRGCDERTLTSSEWSRVEDGAPLGALIQGIVDAKVRQRTAKIDEQLAQMIALQGQISSHFLYNTLECIRGQAVLNDEDEIGDMLETLSNFCRYNISRKESVVTLQEEIVNSLNYMKIQQYRFEGRFAMEVDMDREDEAIRGCYVPKLMIQPIVENAVQHGFQAKRRGLISISAAATEDLLVLTISDDGDGMDADTLQGVMARIGDEGRGGNVGVNGIALGNIEKRIRMLFGQDYGITLYSTHGVGTDVEITLPRLTSRE